MTKKRSTVNLAFALLVALRAYKPKVTVQDKLAFELQRQREKRRTRPLAGRGNYGEGLRAHFAAKRLEAIKAAA